jgi:hypothetical protein
MAEHVTRYALDDGTVVSFEIDALAGYHPAGPEEIVSKVRQAVDPALAAARIVMEKARAAAPDEVQITFGLKVIGEANWWVAKAASEGNFEVSLTWKAPSAAE